MKKVRMLSVFVDSRDRFGASYKGFDVVEVIEVAWAKVSSTSTSSSSTYASWLDKKKRTVNIVTELFTSGNLRENVNMT